MEKPSKYVPIPDYVTTFNNGLSKGEPVFIKDVPIGAIINLNATSNRSGSAGILIKKNRKTFVLEQEYKPNPTIKPIIMKLTFRYEEESAMYAGYNGLVHPVDYTTI